MYGTNNNEPQVHSEVENLKNSGFGCAENDDATEFREGDASKDGAPSPCDALLCSLDA